MQRGSRSSNRPHPNIPQVLAASLAVGMMLLMGGCRPSPPSQPSRPAGGAPQGPADEAPGVNSSADTSTTPPVPATSPSAQAESPPSSQTTSAALSGRDLYLTHCAACHGERGDGNGIAAPYLFPKPRDFRAGRFRLVSTANNVPSREDLLNVLQRGMPGSAMPPWPHLAQAERELLVDEIMRIRSEGARDQYIQSLKQDEGLSDDELAAPEIQQEIDQFVARFTTPGASTVVPQIPEPTGLSLARGRELYVSQACQQCHGTEGKGDGVQKMVDDEGLPTRPRDFTAGIFKGGHDPASLYRRIAYGMPGTPMPSSKNMTPEQMTDLVHFILSMSTEQDRERALLTRERIVAHRVNLLPALDDPLWSTIAPVPLRTTPLWWRDGADPRLHVQALHDGQQIAFRLTWKDPTDDRHAARTESFEDAVAIELFHGAQEPFIGMGSIGSVVDVWLWDADRQGALVAEEEAYPHAVVDVFPFSETAVVSAELSRAGARMADQPDVSLTALAVGNAIVPIGARSGASDLVCAGPGSVTFRPPTSQHVQAIGQWVDGEWQVLMTRPLVLPSESDGVTLQPGMQASIGLAVWDGSHQDRNGKKQVTIWQDLELEK